MSPAIGMADDNRAGSDLLQNDSCYGLGGLTLRGIAGNDVPLDGSQPILLEQGQGLSVTRPIREAKNPRDPGDFIHLIRWDLPVERPCLELFPQDLILGLRSQDLLFDPFGIEEAKIGMSPGVIANLEQRVGNELHRFFRMRKHPFPTGEEGGLNHMVSQVIDEVGVVAGKVSRPFTKIKGQGDNFFV